MSLKLLFLIGNLDVGGAERHLVQILPLLKNCGFSIVIYTITNKGKLAYHLENSGIQVVEPWFSPLIRKLPTLLKVPLLFFSSSLSYTVLVLKYKPNILHFFLPTAYLFGGIIGMFLRQPLMIMSRRSLNKYQLNHPVLSRFEKMLHGRMKAVLGNSSAVISDLVSEGVAKDKLGLIYNGIDFNYTLSSLSKCDARKCLDIDSTSLVLVCVANLIPYKGHRDLFAALSLIKNSLPKRWSLLLVGRDSGIQTDLDVYAKSLGIDENVVWLGERNDVPNIYRAADIGILCSHEEGFSNSILEGMANGIPMVVTDVGGNAEAVLDGECGIVVPPHDPAALANSILSMVQDRDLRIAMSLCASSRVRNNFTIDVCVEKYAHVYSFVENNSQFQSLQQSIESVHIESGVL